MSPGTLGLCGRSPIPSSCPSPSGEGTQGQRFCSGWRIAPPVDGILPLPAAKHAGPSLSLRGGRIRGRDNRRQPLRRRQGYRPSILCTSLHQGTGRPLFLSVSLWRRDAGEEVSALVGVSPLPSMVSQVWPCQNVPDCVSPSEEGEQEGGTTRRERSGRRRAQRLAVLGRTPNQRPGPSPSPLPVLLPPEKGRGGGGLCSGWRIAPPVDGILALPAAERAGPRLSLRGGRTRGRDNRRQPSSRRQVYRRSILCMSPHQRTGLPLFLSFSLWRRDSGGPGWLGGGVDALLFERRPLIRRGRSRGSGCRSSADSACGGRRARRRGGAGRG